MAGNVTTTPRPVLDTPRIRELKRERAKTRKRKILLWFIACILFFVGLGFLSNIPQMRITNVVIEGRNPAEFRKF
jgi:cell division septal protein FtsQ